MNLSDSLGMIGVPAIGGALAGWLGGKANEKASRAGASNYNDAINYLMGQQNVPVRGFYGTGGTTGDAAYDNAVRAVALGQLGQQLDAAKLDIARGNMTDAQARALSYAKEVALRKAVNDGAMNAAAKAAVRLPAGTNNMGSLYSAGMRNGVRGNAAAYANAMDVIANNDANYQNNPAYSDALNQIDQGNQRQTGYSQAIAHLMANRPTGNGYNPWYGALSAGLGGLFQGFSNNLEYGR